MLGLIKKDLLLIKANLKSMLIIFIVYLLLAFQGTFEVTFVVPLIGVMLFISTFSYDDYNHWNAYAITLPDGRKNVVRAKYITSILLIIFLGITSLFLLVGIDLIKANSFNLEEMTSSLMGTILASTLIISLFYPFLFKYGSTNGRIILFVFAFVVAAIGTIASSFFDISSIIHELNILDKYFLFLIPLFSIILLGISYFISNKIYKSKEF